MTTDVKPVRRRRRFLVWSSLVAFTLVLGLVGWSVIYYVQARLDTVGDITFDQALAIPPLAESELDETGARVFHLDIQSGQTQFRDGPTTATWGVNGTFLGPTIRASRGEEVSFAVTNSVDEATSLHWHGMHLPAEMDGGPHQVVTPGSSWRPHWTIDQPAATLWYHPHLHGATGDHVLRGLAGMFIVDDEDSQDLGLPGEYGVDDIPVMVMDRSFDGDNQFDDSVPLMSTGGFLGDEVLVNGTPGAYLDVTTRLVRLRLLNASHTRGYNFGFSDDRAFHLIGTDGGLLPEPWETDRLYLSAGERAEVVVAFEPGETVELRSYPTEVGGRFDGGHDRLDLLQLRVAENLTDRTELPPVLGTAPDLDSEEIAQVRSFELSGRDINGRRMEMDRIDFGVQVGTTEVWELVNTNGYPHNFHVHDVQFQVLDVNGEPPPPYLAGWKDTVMLLPDVPYRLALRFNDHTDPNIPYMFHCHLLLHEDEGMMGQFVVLDEGEEIGEVPSTLATHDHQ